MLMKARILLPILLAPVAGCDIPTELPRLHTEWEVPVVDSTVSTQALLPSHVRATAQGFVIDSFTVSNDVRLRDVCELCTCFEGPIPPLTLVAPDWRVQLPPLVLGTDIESGRARLVLHNEMAFDLLDDGRGHRGFLQVELVDVIRDEVLERRRLEEPFPPGDSLAVDFDLGGLKLTRNLVARVSGETPGTECDVTPLDPDDGFRAEVEIRDVVASSAEIILTDASLRLPSRSLDLPDFVFERLQEEGAEVQLQVDLSSSVPTEVELGLSAASGPESLFTEEAALWSPLILEASDPASPLALSRTLLLDLEALDGAREVRFDTDNRVLGDRVVTFVGGERLDYRIVLRATVPTG